MSVNTGASCSAQCFRTLPKMLSRPGLFCGLHREKRWRTSDCLMLRTDAGGGGGRRGGGWWGGSTAPIPALQLSKWQKKLFSWFALSRPSLPDRTREDFPLPLWGTLVIVLIPCHASRGLPDTRVASIFCLYLSLSSWICLLICLCMSLLAVSPWFQYAFFFSIIRCFDLLESQGLLFGKILVIFVGTTMSAQKCI